jgi:hypothetical protein
MRDEYRHFFPPLPELPYVDQDGKQQLLWAAEVSYVDVTEPYVKPTEICDLETKADPAGIVSDLSKERVREKKLEELDASLTDKERALWKILKHQAETLDKSQRGINITAAATELDISRQMAHRYLNNIREKAQRLGLGDLL